jgi:hypothetical protein
MVDSMDQGGDGGIPQTFGLNSEEQEKRRILEELQAGLK